MDRQKSPDVSVEEYLASRLDTEKDFQNPPEVQLTLLTQSPPGKENVGARDIAITTAYQCYSPGKAVMKPRTDEKGEAVADSTLEAGHHTTRMHYNMTWRLAGISRHAVHDVLHDYPFYNSEQQSQRYTEAREGFYVIPSKLTPEQEAIYIDAANYANAAYFDLLQVLPAEIEQRIREMYPPAGWNVPKTAERLNGKIQKISLEVARYVLPVAQQTTFYHTLNELQLLRLFRASQMEHFNPEAQLVIAKMVDTVLQVDPTLLRELRSPLPTHPTSFSEEYIDEQREEFDSLIGNNESQLVAVPENTRQILALAVRNVLKISSRQMSDEEALSRVMDPRKNPYLGDTYDVGIQDPLTQALRQIQLTYLTKISHTADSQRQRHRMTPGANAPLAHSFNGTPDYITPLIVRETPLLKEKYDEIMGRIYANVQKALDAGIPREAAVYLLPNAHTIRIVESGDMFDWLHRWKQRLCYLAQEEIFFTSVEQVEQLLEKFPETQTMLYAPCGLAHRAGTGKCPEGDRWCGKGVWGWELDKYRKGRLV